MTDPYNSTIVYRAVRKGGRYMGPERFEGCEVGGGEIFSLIAF